MDFYQYKAVDGRGRIKTGRIDASNVADLESRLQRAGLDLVNYKEVRAVGRRVSGRGVSRRDLILFCFHLQQTVQAGVPVLESLQDLRDSTENLRLRDVIAAMLEAIDGGRTLSSAMTDFPHVFSRVFVSLIRAGEQTGELSVVLERLGENLKWQDEQTSMTRRLLMYPLFVATVVAGVLFFLMTYLVPELLFFVKTMGSELPAHTIFLIAVSNIFVDYWYLILMLPVLMIAAIAIANNVSASFRLGYDRLTLNIPVIGPIFQKLILARLSGFFAMMYASGITIIDCLRTAEEIAGNRAIAGAIHRVGQSVADGKSLGDSFQATGLFPPLVMRMIRVGESSGALESALENIAYFYTRDVRESIERLQTMIEPAMTLILGAIIGWVMFSVLMPVYDLIANIRV